MKLRGDIRAKLHDVIAEVVFQHLGRQWNGDRGQQRLTHDLERRVEVVIADMLTPEPRKYADEVEWGEWGVKGAREK